MRKTDSPASSNLLFTRKSLLGRFFLASLMILPLFIILSGTLLLESFAHSQFNAEKEKLQTHIYLLLGLTEIDDNRLLVPKLLSDPRLNQQNSGLYAAILDERQRVLWRSESSMLLPKNTFALNNSFQIDQFTISEKQLIRTNNKNSSTITLNALNYDIEWLDDNNFSHLLRFIIIKDSSSLQAEISSYRSRLWQWLSLMGIGFILIQVIIMKWGLKPLKKLSRQLKALQKNDIQTLDKNYPNEVQPVIDNLNGILKQEKLQRERYRNSLSDLAHSLKTPLAVINSQLAHKEQKDNVIDQQLYRINQIITHQLQRAVIRSQSDSINQRNTININPVINRLIQVMEKVYTDKKISFNNLTDPSHKFMGDEADLLEVIGNILDNACKHGDNQITIDSEQADRQLKIRISDNGKGIPDTIKTTILERGARADTAQTGQGIGLTVAVDIISSYKGSIKINNNAPEPHLSGACFEISFP